MVSTGEKKNLYEKSDCKMAQGAIWDCQGLIHLHGKQFALNLARGINVRNMLHASSVILHVCDLDWILLNETGIYGRSIGVARLHTNPALDMDILQVTSPLPF